MTHTGITLLLIALVIAGVLIVILSSSIHVTATVSQSGGQVDGQAHIRALWGIVHLKRKLKQMGVTSTSEGPAVQTMHSGSNLAGKPSDESEESVLTSHEVWHYVKEWPQIVAMARQSWPPLKGIMHRTRISAIDVSLRVGCGDPVLTGCAVGAAWAGLSVFVGLVSSFVVLTDMPKLSIDPDFNHLRFETEARCIGHVKVGYVIVGALQMLRVWSRFKADHDQITSPRSEEETTWSTPSRDS